MEPDTPPKVMAAGPGPARPPCQAACPLGVRAGEIIRLIHQGDTLAALTLLREGCPFPGLLSRLCPRPCETACRRAQVEAPVAIAALARYVADRHPEAAPPAPPGPERPEPVAVVGGGPAGLMAAYELRRRGYPVALFEADQALGGALRQYIPPYRLPREVLDREVSLVEQMGTRVRLRTRLGRDFHLEDLRRDFAAVFLALGAHKSLPLPASGADLDGVLDALNFLRYCNAGYALPRGRRVAVIGGGRAALAAARLARRRGAASVAVICRKYPEEPPAAAEESAAAASEGVEILRGWEVTRLLGREGKVAALELRGVDAAADLTILEVDQVITAVGRTADFSFFGPGLAFDTATVHRLEAHPITLQTMIPGVFAGGDLVTGPAGVLEALAAGRRAARAMEAYLRKQPRPEDLPSACPLTTPLPVDLTGVVPAPRQQMPSLSGEESLANPQAEVDLGYDTTQAQAEAARCLACDGGE